jgi:hypothetical protein
MCKLGQEGGAPIGREIFSADDDLDWRESNEYLAKNLDPEVLADLRYNRRKLSMHDAVLIVQRFGRPEGGKG